MGSKIVSRRAINPLSPFSGTAAATYEAAACLCCCGNVPRYFVFTHCNCCWILQVAATKGCLSMDRARSNAHNITGHGGGRLHAAFLPGRVLCDACCVCCVLLFEIPGVSNARAVRFWFCFYVQIRIAWHVRASSLALVHMYMCICQFVFFLREHLFVLAPLFKTSDGLGTIRSLGLRCRWFGRDPCCVSRLANLLNYFVLRHT